MAHVKGTSISGRLKYVQRYFGDAKLDEVMAGLSDQEAATQIKRSGALRSSWYPLDLLVDLSRTIDKVCGHGDGKLYRTMAGQVAEDDLSTVYKVFFKLASPGFIIEKAAQVWRQYYDSGEMVVLERQPGHAIMELRDFDSPNAVHCEMAAGWMERSIAMSGGKDVVLEHAPCRGRGGERCRFEARWRE